MLVRETNSYAFITLKQVPIDLNFVPKFEERRKIRKNYRFCDLIAIIFTVNRHDKSRCTYDFQC
jgi:hypothetical protein